MSAGSPKGTTDEDRQLGLLIRQRRLAAGMSQQALANALGITFPQVQKYENGSNRISFSRLLQVAKTLGTSGAMLTAEVEGSVAAGDDASRDRLAAAKARVPAHRLDVFYLAVDALADVAAGAATRVQLQAAE